METFFHQKIVTPEVVKRPHISTRIEGDTYLYPWAWGAINISLRQAFMSKANFPSWSESVHWVM